MKKFTVSKKTYKRIVAFARIMDCLTAVAKKIFTFVALLFIMLTLSINDYEPTTRNLLLHLACIAIAVAFGCIIYFMHKDSFVDSDCIEDDE